MKGPTPHGPRAKSRSPSRHVDVDDVDTLARRAVGVGDERSTNLESRSSWVTSVLALSAATETDTESQMAMVTNGGGK